MHAQIKLFWTSLSKVLDKHIILKAYAFHKVQHQLNQCSKFHENSYCIFVLELHYLKLMWSKHYGTH